MASVINTNNASLVAQRSLSASQTALTASVQRLSSGMRINGAKDDAAGLGISQRLRTQITGAQVSARNANDAISMVQTAEGGMHEVSGMLQRMRELATQGNNDSLDNTQRGYIATEITALRSEINQIGSRTTFNGKVLLNGSISSGTAQVGSAATAAVADFGGLGFAADRRLALSIDGVALADIRTGAMATPDGLSAQLNLVTEFASKASAAVVAGKLQITSNTTGASSSVVLVYFEGSGTVTPAQGTDATADYQVATVATGLQFQLGATSADDTAQIGSGFKNVKIDSTANRSNFDALNTLITTVSTSGSGTSANFGLLTEAIDPAIATLAAYRSDLGAMSNRLDQNIANLQAQSENLTASMGRILDTDYAAETATLSKDQVMQQAATAMLAQANQMPNAVLSMLK